MTLVPVLMYHAVTKARDRRFQRWVIPPTLLTEHLDALAQSGYRLVGMSEWAAGDRTEPTVVLTFDDGYYDFCEVVVPILLAAGASATVYVVTGLVGEQATWLPFSGERTRPLMSWDDCRQVAARGIEVGSHSHRHAQLDIASPSSAWTDICASRDALRARGLSPRSFCYPYGYWTRAVRALVGRAGFTTACIVGHGLFDSESDHLSVRRLAVDAGLSPEALLARVRGSEQTVGSRAREQLQPAWRAVRRLSLRVRGSTGTGDP